MTYIYLALFAAIFTSLTTILAKIGIRQVNSNFATFYRTLIVIICSFLICLISGNLSDIKNLTEKNLIFIFLSGIATGISWLCYYKAIKIGDVNKVVPIDKSSFVLTTILFMIFFFDVTTKNGNVLTIIMIVLSVVFMLLGTMLMISKKEQTNKINSKYLLYAIISAVFASFVSLFMKIGLKGINGDLGTFLRTIIVLIFSLCIVLFNKDYKGITKISKKSWIFLTLSAVATGLAWILEFEALASNFANPVVVSSIIKFSILITMLFSYLILKEKFTKKSILGLAFLTIGIMIVVIFGL